jgi:hypothetical protein
MALPFEQQPAAGGGNPKPEALNLKAVSAAPAKPLPFEQQPKESAKAFAAFSVYLGLGPDRTLAATAAKVGKSKRMMEKWSLRWSWCGRVVARAAHLAEVERGAIERQAIAKAVEWAKMTEAVRREAWLEAERAISMVREARERWEASGRTPGFEGMARMLELAFKLKQFAAGMPSEIREVNTTVTGTVDVDWEIALRRAYGPVAAPPADAPAVVDVDAVPALEDKR